MPYAKIATKQATYTLEQLHAELGGKLLANKAEALRLVKAMKHVEAVLKLLDPDYSLRRISVRRRKQNPWFKRGTVLRRVMDVLRTADGPLAAREATERMVRQHGVTDPKPEAIRSLTATVSSCLQSYQGRGIAAHFDVNPGRISEIKKGVLHPGSHEAARKGDGDDQPTPI